MPEKPLELTLRPIGFVRNEVREKPAIDFKWENLVSELVIDRSLTESLDGLEDFSHIIVLFWFHKVSIDGELPPKTHPKGDPNKPLVGRFATRSPHRPNPIGKATVRLLERRGNVLKVAGLDALDGTPVLDVKPYIPRSDSATGVRVPSWVVNQ
ncbi:MAG: tRNA (N6-threonylcarbamoyladenosine(37)-N6)-methyltransferase TrmO [Chloroflexi bacterium]|nr:tRNA (N6-threonylcarbamoyladenosine(37)-N6)-methyltransferase TrmO [Chloroflexota bacterium]